jgi:alpha-D-ribose 1-methylphosphonate 5-triphosphate synthase subunit PhnH
MHQYGSTAKVLRKKMGAPSRPADAVVYMRYLAAARRRLVISVGSSCCSLAVIDTTVFLLGLAQSLQTTIIFTCAPANELQRIA